MALVIINASFMSEKSISRQWTNTQINLSRLLVSEISTSKNFDSKRQANDYVRRLFIQYNEILRKFDDIYQTLLQPQKRLIIRIFLDAIVGRLVELKYEMIKFDSCEYTYFEDLALDQNKTLDDLCIQIPQYFARDRFDAIQQRNQTIQIILDRLDSSKNDLTRDSSSDPLDLSTNVMTLASAIRVLQAHERARQGRIHAYFMRRMKTQTKTIESKDIGEKNIDESCRIIQTIWRQKYAEKLYREKKKEHAQILGMTLPRRNTSARTTHVNEKENKRRILQQQHQQELDQASMSIKQQIRRYEETEIKSRMQHILMQWLLESRQLYGQFPIYPMNDVNGSAMLFKEMSVADVQEFVNKQAQALKIKKTKRKEVKKPAVKKNKPKPAKQKALLNQLDSSKFLPMINDQMAVYKELFYERDESHNPTQQYDQLLTIDQFRPEVEEELRKDVDEILRNELIYLKLAIDNVEDKKSKKKKKKNKKKKKGKKKSKDLVGNRTNDSIFEELVETGIILPTKFIRQEDFLGDYQYLAETIRYNEKEPMPSLLDCQQLVILQIIFPLCSPDVHRNLPLHKGVFLAGPRGSGKEMLVHFVCSALGALLLDLSPANLAKSFNTGNGLRVLFAMIKRLVISMPPVICLVRNTELLFSKKLSSQEKGYQPRRLQKILRQFTKKIKPGERIMFVGLSSQPYRARIKPLLQIFKNIILFPRPNYGSRRKILYESLIEKHNMNITDVELSILASISRGYTAGQILETIEKVVEIKEEKKHVDNLCTSNDFLPLLTIQPAVFLDEENKIKNWYAKTPNGIKRLSEIVESSSKKRST